MPEVTEGLFHEIDAPLRALIAEAIDFANGFPTPHRARVHVIERDASGYQLGEHEVLDMPRLRDEVLLQCEGFAALGPLTEAITHATEEEAANMQDLHNWTLAQIAQPVLAAYFAHSEHPVVFDDQRLHSATARVLALAATPHAYVHIHPLTKVDVTERIEVLPGVVLRPVDGAEVEEWLNQGPFDPLVPQQTVMDIGGVIEVDYDGNDGPAVVGASETANRLTTVLQLVLDCDAVSPFNEERHRATRALRSAGYPGTSDWHAGGHGEIHAADGGRLAQDLQRVVERSAIPGVQLALRRWRETPQRDRDDDKLIDYWIALEALFMPDSDRFIKATVARRASNYTGIGAVRAEIAQQLRDSYKCRSELVHGGHVGGWNIDAIASQTRGHLRAALLKVVEDAVPFSATAWGHVGPL